MKNACLFILLIVALEAEAQSKSEFGVTVIDDLTYYQEQVQENALTKMIDLETVKGLQFDIRYATTNNFTKQVIYPEAKAFARKEVAQALEKIALELEKKDLALKIYDAYRPYDATVLFYEIIKDTTYVASPYSGSRHNRGCAVDLTIVDSHSGLEIVMPTDYDDFSEKAHPDHNNVSKNERENRDFLIDIMERNGFKVYPYEWWHFDYEGWEQYPIMNLSFKELKTAE